MVRKYGYLGPEGTHCEEALYLYLGSDDFPKEPYSDIEQVISAVISGKVTHGIIPVENSIEGTVNQALDLLASDRELKIIGEVILPVRHSLLVKSGGSKEGIKAVISHPQALAQCRSYLKRTLPQAVVSEVNSTAEAARMVAEGGHDLAAIANSRAAVNYNLDIIEQDIQDYGENRTRFVIVSKDELPVVGEAKTSLVVSITDRPGGLYQILKEFALANINLTKIVSRPAKTNLGDYLFFIDLAGHRKEPVVDKCLKAIEDMTASFHILGSYPVWQENVSGYKNSHHQGSWKPSIDEIRQDIDIIDSQIVELLAKRTQLVSVIGNLKSGRPSCKDENREKEVLERAKKNAVKKGVSPDLIEDIYSVLFKHFVDLQQKLQAGEAKSRSQDE